MGKESKRRHVYRYGNDRVEIITGGVVMSDGKPIPGKGFTVAIAVSNTEPTPFTAAAIELSLQKTKASAHQAGRASKPRKTLLIPKDEPGQGEPVTREWLLADKDKYIAATGHTKAFGWQKDVARRLKCSVDKIQSMVKA